MNTVYPFEIKKLSTGKQNLLMLGFVKNPEHMNFQGDLYPGAYYPRTNVGFNGISEQIMAIIIITALVCIITGLLLDRYYARKTRKRAIQVAFGEWREAREELENWIQANGEHFEDRKAQSLIQRELGALTLFTILSNTYTKYHEKRVCWLSSIMDDEYIADTPNKKTYE